MRVISKSLVVLLLVIFFSFAFLAFFASQKRLPQTRITPTPQIDQAFVVNIPQKALFRNTLAVSALAAPGTSCRLTYISPSGESVIMETIADTDGICSWRWIVDETKGTGAGRLIFTIDGVSETHFIEVRSDF
jgi:hypothetical protein